MREKRERERREKELTGANHGGLQLGFSAPPWPDQILVRVFGRKLKEKRNNTGSVGFIVKIFVERKMNI